jgi:copper chaperone
MMTETLEYAVAGMSCSHCKAAVTDAVSAVERVETVVVDLDGKRVEVTGDDLDDGAIRRAIAEAGYEAA